VCKIYIYTHTYIRTHTYIYIYIYIYVCECVCVYVGVFPTNYIYTVKEEKYTKLGCLCCTLEAAEMGCV